MTRLPNPIQAWYHYVFNFIASTVYELYSRYIEFIDQKLHPSQFIVWDMENNRPMEKPVPPEEPYLSDPECDVYAQWKFYEDKYQQAEEKVLFEGFNYEPYDKSYDDYLVIGNDDMCFDYIFEDGIVEFEFDAKTIADLVDVVDIKDSVAKKLQFK